MPAGVRGSVTIHPDGERLMSDDGRAALSGGLYGRQPDVVVGQLAQVSQCDLRGEQRVVVGHVGERVVATMLQLDFHPGTELLQVHLVRHSKFSGQGGDVIS